MLCNLSILFTLLLVISKAIKGDEILFVLKLHLFLLSYFILKSLEKIIYIIFILIGNKNRYLTSNLRNTTFARGKITF